MRLDSQAAPSFLYSNWLQALYVAGWAVFKLSIKSFISGKRETLYVHTLTNKLKNTKILPQIGGSASSYNMEEESVLDEVEPVSYSTLDKGQKVQ